MRAAVVIAFLTIALVAPLAAATPGEEIQYLLDAVGRSGCDFTRNGTRHTAAEARAHLAMKYERAGSRVRSPEAFIDRLASESSWTGRPYLITCDGRSTTSREWLTEQLQRFRAAADRLR